MERLDGRSLALFRIGLAGVLIFELLERLFSFRFFFGQGSVFKNQGGFGSFPLLSIYQISSNSVYHATWLILSLVAAVTLLVGYRTRFSIWVSWFLLLNLQHYASDALYVGDDVLRILLFWGCFLPLGSRLSIDAKYAEGQPAPKAWAEVAFTGQIVVIFMAAGFHKAADLTWINGEALGLVLAAQESWIRLWLSPLVLQALNYIVIVVELLVPLFLFAGRESRLIALWILVGFEIAQACTLKLGFLPYIMSVGVLALVPSFFWASRAVKAGNPQITWTKPLVAVAAVVMFLLPNLSRSRNLRSVEPVTQALIAIGLDQEWSMFTPIATEIRWLVVRALTVNDEVVDVFSEAPFVGWQASRISHLPPKIRWDALIDHFPETTEIYARIAASACRAGEGRATRDKFREVELDLISLPVEELHSVDASAHQEPIEKRSCIN